MVTITIKVLDDVWAESEHRLALLMKEFRDDREWTLVDQVNHDAREIFGAEKGTPFYQQVVIDINKEV